MRDGHVELKLTSRRGVLGWLSRTFGQSRPHARVTATAARLGARLEVDWSVEPAPDDTLVTISLVGAEVARKRVSARSGISVVTQRSEFFTVELSRQALAPDLALEGGPIIGSRTTVVPAALVPSFVAKLNEIAWAVVIELPRAAGGTHRLEFPLTMRPVRG